MFLLTERAFLLSELTGQTIPVAMRISLLIKTVQPISQILNIMHEGDSFFSKNPLKKADFICICRGKTISRAKSQSRAKLMRDVTELHQIMDGQMTILAALCFNSLNNVANERKFTNGTVVLQHFETVIRLFQSCGVTIVIKRLQQYFPMVPW